MTNYERSSVADQPDETMLDRLVRMETRIVKIMEALGLDPRTGNTARKRRPETHTLNERHDDESHIRR